MAARPQTAGQGTVGRPDPPHADARTPWLAVPPAGPGQSVALFGGSFNPPHRGHLSVATAAIRRLGVDRVWWLVTPGNPLKSHDGLAPLAERVAAVEALARHPRMAVTAFEKPAGLTYSAQTVRWIAERRPAQHFVWLMGADNLAQFHRWRDWRTIAARVPLAVVDRPGASPRALASPAALALARFRLPEASARALPRSRPPAWVFLHARLDASSSTALRGRMGSEQSAS